MLIDHGVLRLRAGLDPALITVPLGASSRRGAFAREGDAAKFTLYAKTFPTEDSSAEWLRIEVDELHWIDGTALAHALGRTDAKGSATVAAHDRPALGRLHLAVRIYKNASNFELALTLAWNPVHERTALIVGTASAAERAMRRLAQRSAVEEAIVLDPHRFVLAPAGYDRDTPPWDNLLGTASARLAITPSPDAPLVILAERPHRHGGETGATVAIDFGTHETSVVTQREGQRDITVQGGLAPWSFHCVSVSLQGAAWHAELIAPPRSFEERTTLGNPIMPRPLAERWSVMARRDASRHREETGVPSVLIPRRAVPDGIDGHPFDERRDPILGHRALRLVRKAIERGPEPDATSDNARPATGDAPEAVDVRVEVDALEPAPKLQIARNRALTDEYLRGLFDELAAREIVKPTDGGLGSVGPILLSYPVAFLADDRARLEASARDALAGSALRGLCADPPDQPLTFLDEATAASLGALYHRFGSLSLDRLLDAFQPFSVDPDGPKTPRAVRALTFDCGGGTTDLVLLRLREDGDRIVSEIEDFYGLPFAGVEITRRLCRELKRRLRPTLPADQQEKLRTRFARDDDPPGAARSEADRLRHKRTLGFFYFGEALKMALAAAVPTDPKALRAAMAVRAQQFLPELDVTRVLDALPDRAWLEECSATVLAPALETAERWLSREDAPVQVVLASGRSSQLPGVGERLRVACARAPRPVLAQHFLSPREFASTELGFGVLDLHAARSGKARADLSKLGVALGLAHGYVLTTKTGEGRRLVVQPADEHKRTRYVGILRQEGRGVQFVMPEDRLVVRADNKPVAHDEIVWIDEQPFAMRAVLGQNFRGPPKPGAAGSVDPPIPFAQVRFTPASIPERERLGNKRVQVGFAQRSSSEVAMVGLRVEREGGVETSLLSPEHPIGAPVSITAGGLTAHFETRRLEFDFRRNGAIDPEDLDRE
ncbi:MAG: hypothetical protein Q8S73_38020 [Deltaproteobacteria bacterium]|nr:hypothetical protein [Myxococcales bacterium]MDP3219960.1 hypothetical protein [Deltaproteobacteria bacterium]